jgi:hypothetical protein
MCIISTILHAINQSLSETVSPLPHPTTGWRRPTTQSPKSPTAWGLVLSLSTGGMREGASFLCSVVRIRACHRWCIVRVMGAAPRQINLSQLHSHTGSDLRGGVSELIVTCSCRFFRSTVLSPRRSSDLARSVYGRVAIACIYPRRR